MVRAATRLGSLNKYGGVHFENVPPAFQTISGGVRWDMTTDSAVPFSTACTTNADCDDGNSCTTAVCDAAGHCNFTALAAGSACDDGNACTGPDVCNGAGVCSGPAVADGTACGTAMTCTAGVCS